MNDSLLSLITLYRGAVPTSFMAKPRSDGLILLTYELGDARTRGVDQTGNTVREETRFYARKNFGRTLRTPSWGVPRSHLF